MKKLYAIKHSIVILLFLFSLSTAYGQKVGSFDTTITFLSAGRQLSAYVPTNYTSAQKYKLMVCLHGLGDNSINYRNALVNSLNWKAQFPNTIFICPESNSTTVDYHTPEGTNNEEIIRESIKFATTNYTIDTTEIILQGFSLGGRAALRYGLNNPNLFKGLLLNTPAIQGTKEGSNKQSIYPFNLANAKKIPVYISHGGADQIYQAPIDSILEKLIENDCPLYFTRIAGMGHTIPQQAQLGDFTKFFDSTTTDNFGIEVVRVHTDRRTCNGKINGSILIRNTGKTLISSAAIDFSTASTIPPSDLRLLNLGPFQHAILPITELPIGTDEKVDLTVKISTINGNVNTDPFSPNNENTKTTSFVNQSTGKPLPYTEGFDGSTFPPTSWVLNPSGDLISSWYQDEDVKKTGAGSLNAINTVLVFDNTLRFEEIQSPLLDLTSLPNPHITFDYAFNYHKFKSGNDSVSLSDTLEILVSTDCGNTFTRLYRGSGKELATFDEPTLNPNTIEKCYGTNPANENWKKAYLPLSSFASSSTAIISFRYLSGLGGCINIDNVSVGNNPVSVQKPSEKTVALYPNPAQETAYITIEDADIETINVFDISGKHIDVDAQNISAKTVLLNTETLANGVYYVQVAGKDFIQNQKLVIKK